MWSLYLSIASLVSSENLVWKLQLHSPKSIPAFLNLQRIHLWALRQPVGGYWLEYMSCVAGEKDEKCFLLNGLVLSRWEWLLISQQLLRFPVSLLPLLLSVTSCQSAPNFFSFGVHCSLQWKPLFKKEGSQGLSCLGTACCLRWVATVSLFYLNLFIMLLKLIDWNHLRDLRIQYLQVIS